MSSRTALVVAYAKWIISAMVLVVLGSLVWFFNDPSEVSDSKTSSIAWIPEPFAEATTTNDPIIVLSNGSITAPSSTSLWTSVNSNNPINIPSFQSDVVDAVQMKFNTTELRRLVRGDVISITVPQSGTRYSATVEKTKLHAGGIKTVHARQLEPERPFTLLLTLGRKNTFAHLSTIEGSYELVGNTEAGWLMPSANMDQHVDYTKPDYVLPKRSDIPDPENMN